MYRHHVNKYKNIQVKKQHTHHRTNQPECIAFPIKFNGAAMLNATYLCLGWPYIYFPCIINTRSLKWLHSVLWDSLKSVGRLVLCSFMHTHAYTIYISPICMHVCRDAVNVWEFFIDIIAGDRWLNRQKSYTYTAS